MKWSKFTLISFHTPTQPHTHFPNKTNQDYQRHITVLKESLCAKEEHYNMLQADVEELRARMEEKNRLIEKKTKDAVQAVQERNRLNNELTELKDHMDIKDRKISVLQRKVIVLFWLCHLLSAMHSLNIRSHHRVLAVKNIWGGGCLIIHGNVSEPHSVQCTHIQFTFDVLTLHQTRLSKNAEKRCCQSEKCRTHNTSYIIRSTFFRSSAPFVRNSPNLIRI